MEAHMSKIKETVQQKSTELLLLGIAGVIGYLLAIVWKETSLVVFQKVLPELSKIGLLAIISIQFLGLAGTFVYILLTRKISSKYRYDKRIGIRFHRRTGDPFCSSCLASNIESPLQEFDSGWRCVRQDCEKWFANPDYKNPKSPSPTMITKAKIPH
jgi:hypothetical protein